MNEPQQYTLHWRGRESGPYTLGGIRKKLANGEITFAHEILVEGRFITIHEFFESRGEGMPGATHPPARPKAPVSPEPASREQNLAPETSADTKAKRRRLLALLLILLALGAIWFFWPKAPSTVFTSGEFKSATTNVVVKTTRQQQTKEGGIQTSIHQNEPQEPAQGISVTSAQGLAEHIPDRVDMPVKSQAPLPDETAVPKGDSVAADLAAAKEKSKSNESPPDTEKLAKASDSNPGGSGDLTTLAKTPQVASAQGDSLAEKRTLPSDKSGPDRGDASAEPIAAPEKLADRPSGVLNGVVGKDLTPPPTQESVDRPNANPKLSGDVTDPATPSTGEKGTSPSPGPQPTTADSQQSKAAPKPASKPGDLPSPSDPSEPAGKGNQSNSVSPNPSTDSQGNNGGGATLPHPANPGNPGSQPDTSAAQASPQNDRSPGNSAQRGTSNGNPGNPLASPGNSSNSSGGKESLPSPSKPNPNNGQSQPNTPTDGSGLSSVSGGALDSMRSADGKSVVPGSAPPLQQASDSASMPLKAIGQGGESPKPSVVFLVDQSYSMRGEKAEAARRQLGKLLADLDSNTSFYILFFHSSGYDAMPASGPLPATPENIQSMLVWSSTVRHVFGSRPRVAVLRALDFHPGTLWLISDGKFPGSVADPITESNKTVHARINTVGIQSRSGEENLRKLAERNGGVYQFIPAR